MFMKTMLSVQLACFVLTSTFAGTAIGQVDEEKTFKLDVVELLAGREVAGTEANRIQHENFTYWFSSKENKQRFAESPQDFQVQLDGGCGRMGSLSGTGKAALWAVHEGKLYVFASQACRTGFLKNPRGMLELDDDKPQFDEDALVVGVDVLNRLLISMGGAEEIDAICKYSETIEHDVVAGGTTYRHVNKLSMEFSEQTQLKQVRVENHWNDELDARTLDGDRSCFEYNDQTTPMYKNAQREFRRQTNQHLLTVLKSRHRDDFQVACKQETEDSYILSCYYDKTLVELEIDKEADWVMVRFRGRGADATYGEKTYAYYDFREIGDVWLPHQRFEKFDGERVPGSSRGLTVTVEVDQK